MTGSAHPTLITKVSSAGAVLQTDVLPVEEPLEIRLVMAEQPNRIERSISVTMRTPGHDVELAAGFLFTEGIVTSPNQIEKIDVGDEQTRSNVVTVILKPDVSVDLDRLQRNFYTTSSCGVCGKSSLDAIRIARKGIGGDNLRFPASMIHTLPHQLRSRQNVFDQTGGLHASGLFDIHGNLTVLHEDVGRHNALDKVIGEKFLQNELTLSQHILVVSGRTSFELVQKAAMAQIPIIVAVGAPSSLAAALAQEMNITLLGFVRNEQFNIYAHADRILI